MDKESIINDFTVRNLQDASCEAIEKEGWVIAILANMAQAATEGHMDGVIFVKDHAELADMKNVRKLCYYLRHKGLFAMPDRNKDDELQINVSWDWNCDKQKAIDFAEALGDQLIVAMEGLTSDVEDIKEVMGHYFMAKLKGNHSDFRKAIDVVQSHLSEEIPEE